MADEQAGTLAFLQNFYTDVTLYMPLEAHERTPAAAPAAEPVVSASAAVPVEVVAPVARVAQPTAVAPAPTAAAPAQPAPVAPPVAPIPPAASKLPSLAGAGLPAAPAKTTPPAAAAPAAPPTAPVPPYLLTTFSTLGANAQGVVLLTRLPAEQFNKLPRNVFLNNLLKAIGLVMADVVLVNVEGPYPVALQNLRQEIAATRILAFGKNLLDVAVRTTQIYEPVQFPTQGMDYLAGAEIEMIEYDTSLKKRLWAGLKAMFL
ncbi:MAG: hypothetical protein EOO36_16145 [Cytophagaceae bacterium]|nr:MAG: hypothetical protein EOO36_16145 [Cytophagaceae bacterium]